MPNLVGFFVTGHKNITFEMANGASFSRMPPCLTFWFGLVCLLMMFNFSTTTLPAVRSTDNTLPDFPRSRPAITTTVSPLRILVFCSASTGTPSSIRLQHFRSERDDFHELFPTKFPRDRTEDASSHRFTVLINQDAGIAIELDIG